MHCVPSLPPGRLVAVPGTGLLRVPHVDPALLAEKAVAEADSSLAQKCLSHIQQAGVSQAACNGDTVPQTLCCSRYLWNCGFASQCCTSITSPGGSRRAQSLPVGLFGFDSHDDGCTVQVNGSFEVLKGPAADTKASISAALCSKTKADGAAAIVIGSASRGGLKEALLGSIAANLAHNCDVPVVVLHKPRAEAAAGKEAGKAGQHSSGDVTWLLSASTQEILGEVAAEQVGAETAQQVGSAQPC